MGRVYEEAACAHRTGLDRIARWLQAAGQDQVPALNPVRIAIYKQAEAEPAAREHIALRGIGAGVRNGYMASAVHRDGYLGGEEVARASARGRAQDTVAPAVQELAQRCGIWYVLMHV